MQTKHNQKRLFLFQKNQYLIRLQIEQKKENPMINSVVDLSHHNSSVNFEVLKNAAILGVIHKATQGVSYVDPTFRARATQASTCNMPLGAYHFGTASTPEQQAEHFVEVAGTTRLLVLDFEDNTDKVQGSMSLQEAEAFVHRVYELTGRYPGLYSGHTLKEALQAAKITQPEQTELSKCWLWISQYAAKPVIPSIWPDWTLWQYTDGQVGPEPHAADGVGPCDRDYFNGSEEQLQQLFLV
jgi:lysozyme